MALPSPNTPLYNHPLPEIEDWLRTNGCQQNENDIHCWHVKKLSWSAEICLDVDALTVRYIGAGEGGRDLQRTFKYSLSRRDLDEAVFGGP